MTGVLKKEVWRHAEGREACEGAGRDGSDVTTRQGTPECAGRHRKLERPKEGVFPEPSERERESVALLTPGFQISSLQNQERLQFCCFFFFFKFLLF